MKEDEILSKLKEEYNKLADETVVALNRWLGFIKPADTYNYNHTSYGLAHCFGQSSNMLGKMFCISNDQLKYAMYQYGFIPDDITEENWCFKVAEEQDFKW